MSLARTFATAARRSGLGVAIARRGGWRNDAAAMSRPSRDRDLMIARPRLRR